MCAASLWDLQPHNELLAAVVFSIATITMTFLPGRWTTKCAVVASVLVRWISLWWWDSAARQPIAKRAAERPLGGKMLAARTRSAILLGSVLLLSFAACRRPQTDDAAAALPLDYSLPATWKTVGAVQQINIDGDPIPEYLLFFTYDNTADGSGPVGAVIYDNLPGDALGPEVDESQRPSASLMPFPVLPSYRTDGGQGFIAEPGQQSTLAIYPLRFGASAPVAETNEPVPPADALAILGGTTYLTLVWWQAASERYGIAQLHAPSHFEAAPFQPFNWESWRASPEPIRSIISVHPVHDRNLLCYRRRHTLVEPTTDSGASGQGVANILYHEQDLGLDFCRERPASPFYPEGVVLAYLLGNEGLLEQELIDDAARATIQSTAAPADVVYVKDLASYKTIRNLANPNNEIQVCAEVLRPGDYYSTTSNTVAADEQGRAFSFEPTAARPDPPHVLHWLLFTLQHKPFQLEPLPLPDRLTVKNVRELPVPTRHIPLECKVQLSGTR